MTDHQTTRSPRFARAGGRHRFTARRASVVQLSRPADGVIRVSLSGPDFHDFVSSGPADHVRVFFPDPETGVLVAPVAAGADVDGIERPSEPAISRDYTPLGARIDDATGETVVDIDFMVHENPGPATIWATGAAIGDTLVVVGPRGSRGAPQDADDMLLICDETSLPSVSRWIRDVPSETPITVLAHVSAPEEWVAEYLGDLTTTELSIIRVSPDETGDNLLAAVREWGPIGEATFVFAAAEAGALVPTRRYLRRELGLPREQVSVSGYWRRGTAGFDHHAPVDPADPED